MACLFLMTFLEELVVVIVLLGTPISSLYALLVIFLYGTGQTTLCTGLISLSPQSHMFCLLSPFYQQETDSAGDWVTPGRRFASCTPTLSPCIPCFLYQVRREGWQGAIPYLIVVFWLPRAVCLLSEGGTPPLYPF